MRKNYFTDDCPYGEDERNCIRLSSTNGDLGKGMLEIYKANKKRWEPACIHNWDANQTPAKLCSLLGYSSVNNSRLVNKGSNVTLYPSLDIRMSQRRITNIFQDYANCNDSKRIVNVELTCSKFYCGKARTRRRKVQKRIVGGRESKPGNFCIMVSFHFCLNLKIFDLQETGRFLLEFWEDLRKYFTVLVFS